MHPIGKEKLGRFTKIGIPRFTANAIVPKVTDMWRNQTETKDVCRMLAFLERLRVKVVRVPKILWKQMAHASLTLVYRVENLSTANVSVATVFSPNKIQMFCFNGNALAFVPITLVVKGANVL